MLTRLPYHFFTLFLLLLLLLPPLSSPPCPKVFFSALPGITSITLVPAMDGANEAGCQGLAGSKGSFCQGTTAGCEGVKGREGCCYRGVLSFPRSLGQKCTVDGLLVICWMIVLGYKGFLGLFRVIVW
ncbi:hypothetical protein E2C01_052617 [Portunus trituberculatus]|uniref:Uncharacterized protein n=1 Tax=Portunus trituberculatus TaxID=210409 RepID=A0A5B7GE69_PORTR|nr:hypothetical protein [Portunus trituberculatus]